MNKLTRFQASMVQNCSLFFKEKKMIDLPYKGKYQNPNKKYSFFCNTSSYNSISQELLIQFNVSKKLFCNRYLEIRSQHV